MPNDTKRCSTKKMIQGLTNLKNLGCKFAAIYGASPLYDFKGLPEYVKAAEDMGILTTIIVDGIGGEKDKEKIKQLYDAGLRSLTVSQDFVPYDKSSKRKSQAGLKLLDWFYKLPDIRDIEIVTTITNQNYKEIESTIYDFLEKYWPKLWFSFDFLHLDRGNPGSKCKGMSKELLLTDSQVNSFAYNLIDQMQIESRIHQSKDFLIKCVNDPKFVTEFRWKCAPNDVFPSFLTIDADGTVLPCDDFHTDRHWKIWNFGEKEFAEFKEFYSKEIETKCKGCCWSTHHDAALIKRGKKGFNSYVHK